MHNSQFAARETAISFAASDLASEQQIENIRAKLPTTVRGPQAEKVLYVVEINDPKRVLEAYAAYLVTLPAQEPGKTTNPDSISRRNNSHSNSRYLYVGSSALSSLRSRFKRHCGHYNGHDRTFGLKLKKWLAGTPVIITFRYWVLQDDFAELNPVVLQVLEDGLWEELKPLFGKKGQA